MTPIARRTITGLLLLPAMSLAIAGLLAEVVLRVYAGNARTLLVSRLKADPYAVLVEPHGEVGYRPKPGGTLRYWNRTAANVNAMGFRGPVVPIPKAAGSVRIVLLGGSSTHGWGVNDHETIDYYMREMLAARYAGRSFEVVNLGFDGYDSYQLLERLKSDGLKLEPDFVIVNTGVNDVRNARYPGLRDRDPRTLLWATEMARLRDERARGGPTLWTRAKHHFFLARFPGILRAQLGARPDTIRSPVPDAMDYFERNLMRIVDLAEPTRTVVLFSTEPSSLRTKYQPSDTTDVTYWIRDAETTQTYRDSLDGRLRAVVERARRDGKLVAGVPHEPFSPDVFLDDTHLTAEGNRRIAADFVAALEPFLRAPGRRGRGDAAKPGTPARR